MVTMQIILNNNTNNIFMVAMAFLHLSLPPTNMPKESLLYGHVHLVI